MKLKVIILISLFYITSGIVQAQKPEPVYSFAKILKPHDWYVKQAELWWQEIKNDENDENAWYNYFMANRMAKATFETPINWSNTDWLKESEYLMDGKKIVEKVQEIMPNTFMSHYLTWRNEGASPDNYKHLMKAYQMNPDFYCIDEELVVYYATQLNREKRKYHNQRWFEKGQMSPGLLAFNYNMLMSVEKNGILITHGDNDTFPAWMLQDVQNVRNDIQVINVHLMQIDEYRKKIFKQFNIPFLELNENESNKLKKIIHHIIENKPEKKHIYFAITVNKNLYKNLEDDLYLTGLALKYSPTRIDNLAVLRNNFEQKFIKDYLYLTLSPDISQTLVNRINLNYIPCLKKLYNHYKLSGEENKAKTTKKVGMLIAEKTFDKEWKNKIDEIFE